jgi:hypothetical protein
MSLIKRSKWLQVALQTCFLSQLAILSCLAQFNLNAPNRSPSSGSIQSLPLDPLQFNPLDSATSAPPSNNDDTPPSSYVDHRQVQSDTIQVTQNDDKSSGSYSKDGQPAAMIDSTGNDQASATLNSPTYSPYARYPPPSSKTFVGTYYPSNYNSLYPSGFGAYPSSYGSAGYGSTPFASNPFQPLVGHFYSKFQPVAHFFQKITGKLMAPFVSKYIPGYGYGTHLGSPYTNAYDYSVNGGLSPYKTPGGLYRSDQRARKLDDGELTVPNLVNVPEVGQLRTFDRQIPSYPSNIVGPVPVEYWGMPQRIGESGSMGQTMGKEAQQAQFAYREQFRTNSVVNGKHSSTSGIISLNGPQQGKVTGVINAVQVSGQHN